MRTLCPTTALYLVLLSGCSSGVASPADNCALVVRNAKLIMRTYDKDHDGKLNAAEGEFIAERLDAMARQTNRETGSQGGDDNLGQVQTRDENHDGYIELKELAVVPTNDPLKWKSCL